MSHYDTLKVTENASQEEIKKAYRRLASKHHPDKGGSKLEFQKIEEAYRVLSDPAQREQYDLERRGGAGIRFNWNPDVNGMPNIDDIFTQFGFPGQQRDPFERMRHPRKNRDVRINLHISLEETLSPIAKTIQIQTSNRQETVNISVPRGIEHDSTIKYPGLGDTLFETLPRGDLYVTIKISPHPKFRISHYDLLCSMKISAYEAILGTEKEVTSIEGRSFMLKIPPGTQQGTKFRIKDQGLYSPRNNVRGNLLVEVEIEIPKETDPGRISLLTQLIQGQ